MEYVIDGNSMIHIISNSVVSLIKDKFPIDYESSNSPNNELNEFVKKQVRNIFYKYLNSYIFPFKDLINGVHFTIDDTSWRKRYTYAYYEKYTDDVGKFIYKGNRVIDNNNFILNNIFTYIKNELVLELKNIPGFFIYSVIGAEGDDIIAFIVEKFKESDIVIFSGDSDIAQLVTNNGRDVIMLYPSRFKNKQRRIYVNAKVNTSFKYNYQISSTIDTLLRSNFYKLVQYEPGKELLIKIVAGDKKSDNINSVYVRVNAKNKFINITSKRVTKFLAPIFDKYTDDDILKNIDSLNEDFIKDVIHSVMNEFKISLNDTEKFEYIKRSLIRNIRLTRLNFNVILEGMYDLIEKVFDFYHNNTPFNYNEFNTLLE